MKRETAFSPTRDDYAHALQEIDSFIDVSVDDLLEIHRRAARYAALRATGNLRAQDVMTQEVVTVGPELLQTTAAKRLLEHNISTLPVVTPAGELVGIVTEADFLCAVGLPCHHPHYTFWQTLESLFHHAVPAQGLGGTVAEIMVQPVVTASPNDTVQSLIDTMKKHHIKRIVITGTKQQVQGIVTRSNLIRAFLAKLS